MGAGASSRQRDRARRCAGFAAAAGRARRTRIFVWSDGLTQHAHGVQTIEALVNVGLARGWVGREKVGLMPIRGHSGVPGRRGGGLRPALDERAARRASHEVWGFPLPDLQGLTAAEMVDAAYRWRARRLLDRGRQLRGDAPDPPPPPRARCGRVGTRIHQDVRALLDDAAAAEDTSSSSATTRYSRRAAAPRLETGGENGNT